MTEPKMDWPTFYELWWKVPYATRAKELPKVITGNVCASYFKYTDGGAYVRKKVHKVVSWNGVYVNTEKLDPPRR
jgi:hypothetical protein